MRRIYVYLYIYNNTIHSICIYMHCIYICINMYGQNVIHRILMHDFSLIDLQMSCSQGGGNWRQQAERDGSSFAEKRDVDILI